MLVITRLYNSIIYRVNKYFFKNKPLKPIIHNTAIIYNRKNIFIGNKSKIEEYATLNANGKFLKIGENSIISSFAYLNVYGGSISIGNNSYIGPFSAVYGHRGVKIGNYVMIANHVTLIPANHIFIDKMEVMYKQGLTTKGIEIEDDVWIGADVKILDGVKIGHGSVIGAGSVVNKSIPEYSVACWSACKSNKKTLTL
jgi:acetyltransferase-like isoleucine patch superfamily enzyme